jgi:hypothetical protein
MRNDEMLRRVLLAVAFGIGAWLVCIGLGLVLVAIPDPAWVPAIGAFLKTYAGLISLVVAIYVFATDVGAGWNWPGRRA